MADLIPGRWYWASWYPLKALDDTGRCVTADGEIASVSPESLTELRSEHVDHARECLLKVPVFPRRLAALHEMVEQLAERRLVALRREPRELSAADHKTRLLIANGVLSIGTVAAVLLAWAGVLSAESCALIPAAAFSIPAAVWAWRDWKASKRRSEEQSKTTQLEMFHE